MDPEDHDRISKYKWYTCKRGNTYYAIRGRWLPVLRKKLTIAMHREIIDVPEGLFVEHINHHGWDNRKANLRPAADNARNACYPQVNTTSKYRGVCYNKEIRKWRATIVVDRRSIHLGYFKDEVQAAKAYDIAAKKYYGRFAYLNFPD